MRFPDDFQNIKSRTKGDTVSAISTVRTKAGDSLIGGRKEGFTCNLKIKVEGIDRRDVKGILRRLWGRQMSARQEILRK
jgi:hypothetical protein